MAPVGDGFSSISDEDFDGLITIPISIEVAAQWLFNVKAFTLDWVKSFVDFDDEYYSLSFTAAGNLHSDPRMKIEGGHLIASNQNTIEYSSGGSGGQTLSLPLFVKKYIEGVSDWHMGIGSYVTEEGAEVEFSASMTEMQINYTYPLATFGVTSIQNTYTIDETFY